MRTILLFTLGFILFSSCTRYQYLTVSSNDVQPNGRNEFLVSSDTLDIIYNFHGYRGPVRISVYNRSANALQVDWKRSALIIGDRPVSYYNPEMQISQVPHSTGSSTDQVVATISSDSGIEFIPPASSISRTQATLGNQGFDIQAMLFQETVKKDGLTKKVRRGIFTKETSPLVFRSYLTFINAKDRSEFVVDNSFYVSQILESQDDPTLIWQNTEYKGNEFYLIGVSRKKEHKGAAPIVIGAALVTVFGINALRQR